jgi:hypothetical protein
MHFVLVGTRRACVTLGSQKLGVRMLTGFGKEQTHELVHAAIGCWFLGLVPDSLHLVIFQLAR